jgi:hypothetical protein
MNEVHRFLCRIVDRHDSVVFAVHHKRVGSFQLSGHKFLYEGTGMVISPIHWICPACSTLRKEERRVWHLLTGVLPAVLDDVGGL